MDVYILFPERNLNNMYVYIKGYILNLNIIFPEKMERGQSSRKCQHSARILQIRYIVHISTSFVSVK